MTEKWNLDLRFDKDSEAKKEDLSKQDLIELKRILRPDVYSDYKEHELEKTEKELAIIHRMNEAARMLLADLDLPPITISDKYVHIIKLSKFKEKQSEHTNAFHVLGNIFITRRGADETSFIHYLSHEITHELGYLLIHVRLTTEQKNQEVQRFIDSGEQIKTFMHFLGNKKGYAGLGFNEGMTEIISRGLRRAYCDIAKVGSKQKDLLDTYDAYPAQIMVLEEVFDMIGSGDHDKGLYLCAKAYMTGDQEMFKLISDKFRAKGIKDGLKILMQMGTTVNDASATAQKLGFKQAEKNILERDKNVSK